MVPSRPGTIPEGRVSAAVPGKTDSARSQPGNLADFSVLSAEFDRPNRQVTLNPVLSGADADHNLARHVEVLKKEGLTSILFLMDLGKPWQSDFVPALLKHDFEPRVIMPYAAIETW